jgi:hypothetical protein
MRYYILGMLGLLLCFTTQAQQTAMLEGVVVETDARGTRNVPEGRGEGYQPPDHQSEEKPNSIQRPHPPKAQ